MAGSSPMRIKRATAASSIGDAGPSAMRKDFSKPRVMGPATFKLLPLSPSIS